MNTNLQLVRLKATTTTDAEGIHVSVHAEGIPLDRTYVIGWLLGPKHQKLAARLVRAIEAHKAVVPKGVLTDINGKTYLDCDKHVMGKYANADLQRLGFYMTEVQRVAEFLRGIGIPVRFTDERAESFLAGVRVTPEGLVVCEAQVAHPHDLFHEAGHLAVIPCRFWPYLDPAGTDFGAPPAAFETAVETYMVEHPDGLTTYPEDPVCRAILQMGEAEAIAWSYAAMVAAECDLDAYWHPPFDGFDGEAPEVYVGLSIGSHPGIHGLQTVGMTTTRTYPVMSRWLSSRPA